MPTIAIGSSERAATARRRLGSALRSSSPRTKSGERGRRRVVEDSVAGSRSPVAAPSRLRSSTAVSESKPSSWKPGRVDSTARRRRGRARTRPGAHDQVQQQRRAARSPPAARAGPRAPPSAAPRPRAPGGVRTRPRSRCGTSPRPRAARARSSRAGDHSGPAGASAASNSARPVRRPPAGGMPSAGDAARRRRRRACRAMPAAPTGPTPATPRAGRAARRCPASASRNALRGRVVRLAGAAERAGERGEQHERVQVQVAGQLVQVPGGVGLGAQHGVEPLGGQRLDHAVVEDAGGVHDGRDRFAGAQQGRQGVAVGDVARRRSPPGAPVAASSACSSSAPGAAGPRRLASSRCRTPCSATRCRASSAPSPPVPPVTRTVPSPSSTCPRRRRDAGEPRRADLAVADHQLRLARRHRGRQVRGVVGSTRTNRPGFSACAAAHQAPHGGGREVVRRAVSHDERARPTAVGEPLLQPSQHSCVVACAAAAARPAVSTTRQLIVLDRRPPAVTGTQSMPNSASRSATLRSCPRRSPPHGQRVDRQHRRTRRCPPRDSATPSRPVGREPHPHRGSTRGVQGDTGPRERQRPSASVPSRTWRAGRRRAAPGGCRTRRRSLRQRHLGVDVVAAPPGRPQPAEHRAVVEPGARPAGYKSVEVDRLAPTAATAPPQSAVGLVPAASTPVACRTQLAVRGVRRGRTGDRRGGRTRPRRRPTAAPGRRRGAAAPAARQRQLVHPAQPTSSPACNASSRNAVPGNRIVPCTTWSASHGLCTRPTAGR